MADLGLYFGEEDEEQLAQEDKALSYLVLANEQDDSFDPVETENLLAQMSAGSLISTGMELDEDTDVVQLLAEPNLSALEKTQLLAHSQYDFHRSFLARELVSILPQMKTKQAVKHIFPIIRDFSLDPMDSVRETLASQLDKIMLYFLLHTVIDHTIKDSLSPDSYHNQDDDDDDNEGDESDDGSEQDPAVEEAQPEESSRRRRPLPTLPHDIFTPIFMHLLLDQNAGIAHQTRLAVVAVAENVPDEIMESEILEGVIAGLRKLYDPEGQDDDQDEGELNQERDSLGGEESLFSRDNRDEQDGEAELGKMLVVVLLTSLASLLGPERCTRIVIPKLEKFMNYSQFYVRKEIVMAVGVLCRIVSQDVVVSRLLPIYDIFVQDDTWHIRRACCTVLASFIGALPVEMKASKVEEIYDIFSVDVSRSVRNSIMEVLGEVIAGFEKEQVPDALLSHFLDMGEQPSSEHERAVMCAFSFPAVVLTAGPSKWELMKPVYMRLAGTFRSPIRRSLACSLHEIAKILGPELADRDLALAFADCLLAEDEVKEGVLGHVVEFITCLSPKYRSDALHDLARAWVDLERSSNWRLRDSLTGHLSGLCEIAEGEDLLNVLLPLSVKACTDGVSTIRESGVMAFPALWEASKRVGLIPMDTKASGLDFPSSDDEYDERVEDKTARGVQRSRSPCSQHHQDLEDVEMGDIVVTEDLAEQSLSLNSATDLSEEDQQTRDERSIETSSSSSSSSSSASSLSTAATDDIKDNSPSSIVMTTLKDQIIQQTTDFAIHGGFRSRVVAVQIIQSLLDSGLSVTEFEEHFLPLLVDQLSVDTVVNIRIWVARVVSWVMNSGYYGDTMVSPLLQDLLERLQQDLDRDVRIYSGGLAELPKPATKAKAKAMKKKKSSSSSVGVKIKSKNDKRTSIFLQNPKSGQTDRIGEIGGENGTEIELLFDGEQLDDDDEDDDGSEGSNDEEEDEEDASQDEDDSSDESSSEELPSHEATDISISNKARNRNSMRLGMKIMNGGTLIVSGKEIRTPKTSWDLIPDGKDDDEDEHPDNSHDVNVKKEEVPPEEKHGGANHDETFAEQLDKTAPSSLDYTTSHGDIAQEDVVHEDDEDEDEDSGVAACVVPYTALTAHGVSPLDVEMEDSYEADRGQHEDKDEVADGEMNESGEKDDERKDKDNMEEKENEKENHLAASLGTSLAGPQEKANRPESTPLSDRELTGPSSTAFPPLSSAKLHSVSSAWHPPTPLSYAASVKMRHDDSKARVSLALSSNLSTLTSFSQAANIPEPPCPSSSSSSSSPFGFVESVGAKVIVKEIATPKKIVIGSSINKRAQGITTIDPLSSSFPSLSSSPLSSSSAATSLPSRRTTALPFSYASVVASGAAAAASRAFSPPPMPLPLPPAITSPPAALTF